MLLLRLSMRAIRVKTEFFKLYKIYTSSFTWVLFLEPDGQDWKQSVLPHWSSWLGFCLIPTYQLGSMGIVHVAKPKTLKILWLYVHVLLYSSLILENHLIRLYSLGLKIGLIQLALDIKTLLQGWRVDHLKQS